MQQRILHYLSGGLFVAVVIGWSFFLYRIPPQELVALLGLENGYITSFVVSFLGGISTFITIPYQLVNFALGAGGLNPYVIGLVGALGVSLGDSTSYLIGYHGRHIAPGRMEKILHKFSDWLLAHPSWLTSMTLFLYGAFVPFSNDFIVISLGLAHFPYQRMIIPLGLGNIAFNTGLALAGAYGWDFLFAT